MDQTKPMQQFRELIESYPFAKGYWDFEDGIVDIDQIKKRIGVYSHGEQIILRFLVAVWMGENELNFDIIEAASVLDSVDIERVCDWMKNPFWP